MVSPAPTRRDADTLSAARVADAVPTPGDVEAIWDALARVVDPEIPVVSIVELGIVRNVEHADGEWVVTLTPTYSGCPATRVIEDDVRAAVSAATAAPLRIATTLAPAWSTDWIAPEAKRKLADAGIAPPHLRVAAGHAVPVSFHRVTPVRCPNCGSLRTVELARFGSTACKSQYRCSECLEPFDHFKPH